MLLVKYYYMYKYCTWMSLKYSIDMLGVAELQCTCIFKADSDFNCIIIAWCGEKNRGSLTTTIVTSSEYCTIILSDDPCHYDCLSLAAHQGSTASRSLPRPCLPACIGTRSRVVWPVHM